VKNYRRMAMIGALALCLAIVAGCHGTPGANTETWIKQADTSQVLELKFRHVSVLAQMHMAVFGNTVKGSYVLKNGSVATKGHEIATNSFWYPPMGKSSASRWTSRR
jgi:hypothetical protein